MNPVFIDTSAIVALFDKSDKHHSQSGHMVQLIKQNKVRLVLTDYIFDESLTTAMSNVGHSTAVMVGDFILSSKIIEFVWLSDATKMKAWDFFKRHSDKGFSFTDCASFIFMKERKLTRYFAFDKHFNEAGFIDFSNQYAPLAK